MKEYRLVVDKRLDIGDIIGVVDYLRTVGCKKASLGPTFQPRRELQIVNDPVEAEKVRMRLLEGI